MRPNHRLFLSVTALFVCLLPAQLWPATNVPTADPFFVYAGSNTSVLITAYVHVPNGVVTAVNLLRLDNGTILGLMRDDGLEGDATANDQVYSLRIHLSEHSAGLIQLRVAAFVHGTAEPQTSDFTIHVIALTKPSTPAEVNQIVAHLFAASLDAKRDLASFGGVGTLRVVVASVKVRPQQNPYEQTQRLEDDLQRMLEALNSMNQLVSGGNFGFTSLGKRGSPAAAIEDAVVQAQGSSVTLLPSAFSADIGAVAHVIAHALRATQQLRDRILMFHLDGTDPRVVDIAAACHGISLTDASEAEARSSCAQGYEFSSFRPNSLLASIRKDLHFIAVKPAGQAATDLNGRSISQFTALGVITVHATTGTSGDLLDFFPIHVPGGPGKGLLLAHVSNPDTLQVPAGVSDFLYSFGESENLGVALGVPVTPSSVTPVLFAPSL